MFCGCSTAFGAAPNTQVCPVCLGLPGALPVLNRRAVELATRAALALHATVQDASIFARKNYFYPDLPKGYQISQYERPLATGGWLEWAGEAPVRVSMTRVHLEEDAGKSLHHGFPDSDRATYLDFNRSGVPLIEIVTEPDLRSARDAAGCFSRIRELLVALDVNDGNMEEASLRCDANVSVRERESAPMGIKTEVKNVNSFRFLQKALEFEIDRQIGVLRSGGRVRPETRLFDSSTGQTVPMRSKEEARDYRYFAEPDLPPLETAAAWVAGVRAALPELPEARKARLVTQYGLGGYDAEQLVSRPAGAEYFEAMVAAGAAPKAAANWMQGEIRRRLKEAGRDDMAAVPIAPAAIAELIALVDGDVISSTVAKNVFEVMWTTGRGAQAVVDDEGLAQRGGEAELSALATQVIADHPGPVAQYRAGKTATFGFLMGQVMQRSGGRANPRAATAVLRRLLDASG